MSFGLQWECDLPTDTMIFGLMRMWLNDLLTQVPTGLNDLLVTQVPTGHHDLWAIENVKARSFLKETSFDCRTNRMIHHLTIPQFMGLCTPTFGLGAVGHGILSAMQPRWDTTRLETQWDWSQVHPVKWRMKWMGVIYVRHSVRGACQFSIYNFYPGGKLKVAIHNLPFFRASSKHVAGSISSGVCLWQSPWAFPEVPYLVLN